MRAHVKLLVRLAAFGCLVLMSSPAFATMLTPGDAVVPGPGASPTTGVVVGDTGLEGFSFAKNTGSLEEQVITSFSANPFGLDKLTFIYQFKVTKGVVEHMSGADFGAFSTDVLQVAGVGPFGTGTAAAPTANLTSDVTVAEFTLGFVTDVTTTFVLEVNTNACRCSHGTIGIIDGGGETLKGFQPGTVPAPPALVLALAGAPLMAAGYWLRRRRKT